MNNKFRRVLLTICLMALVAVISIGATVAYLTDDTQDVINTFTVGNIDIALKETGTTEDDNGNDIKSFKMIPDQEITKDPKVTVEAGSEKCFVFVKVTKSDNYDEYLTHDIAEGWTELDDGDDNELTTVYWRVQAALTGDGDTDMVYSVLEDDQVKVLTEVEKDDMDALQAEDATLPTLTFRAYAVQFDEVDDVNDAWGLVKNK